MDLHTMDTELLKCEPEVQVKLEPLFTENSYDVTVNNDNLVKTECESVSFSSCNYSSLNDVKVKQECMENDLATLLPTTNISVSVEPALKEEPSLAASEQSQENTGNLFSRSTKNSTSCVQTRKPKTLTKTPKYNCPYCNRNFTRRDLFRIHLWNRHSKKYPYFLSEKFNKKYFTCDICKFKLSCSRSFKSHMIMHETCADTNMVKCHHCDYETSQKCDLRAHIQSNHSNKPAYLCRFCNKTFRYKKSLADHLLLQYGEKFDKSLKTLLSLTIKHCKLCDFRVITQSILNHHIQVQHSNNRPTYICRFCNKTCFRKASLADHLLRHHGEKFDKSLKTLLSLTIKHCNLCDLRTISKDKLDRHMPKHDHSLVKAGTDKIIFKCYNCDYNTIKKHLLQSHIQSKHSNGRPPYSCEFCNKTFFRKASLADHLLLQHGEKFDKSLKTILSLTIKHCKLCDFRIVMNSTLTYHIQRQHSDNRPSYSCRICKKTVSDKASLADHLLSQHGNTFVKSLKTLLSLTIKHCNLCDFRTINKGMLNRHIQRKHSNDI